MNIFLDTSVLFKLYHLEEGSTEIGEFIDDNQVENIFLAQITKLEFESTVWKKVRKKELDEIQANNLIQIFHNDFSNYTFIDFDGEIEKTAFHLMSKYGKVGLRTLDSIQFASTTLFRDLIDKNKTADKLLQKLLDFRRIDVIMILL